MNIKYLIAIISFIRHGEKDDKGLLTQTGKLQATKRGEQLRYLDGNIKLFHSGVQRVKETVETINSVIKPKLQDGVNASATELKELHYELDIQNSSHYFSSWTGKVSTTESNKRMQAYLNFKNETPEPERVPSPQQVAQRVGRLILKEIEEAITKPHLHHTNFINGTHEPVIMAFLFYALNDFKPGNSHFVEEVGGSINYTEGFDINIYISNTEKIQYLIDFRGFLKELNVDKLRTFVSVDG